MSGAPVEKKYGLMHVVTPEFAADRPALENFMRADLLDQLRREGDYEVIPGSFDLELVDRTRINGEPFLTDEEREAGMTGDEMVARATVRCYRKPTA